MNEKEISESLIRLEESVKHQLALLNSQTEKIVSIQRKLKYLESQIIEYKTKQKAIGAAIKWGASLISAIIVFIVCTILIKGG